MIKKLKFITSILYGKINYSLFILSCFTLIGMIFEFVGLGLIFPLIISLIEPNKLLEFELIEKVYDLLNFTSFSHERNKKPMLSMIVSGYTVGSRTVRP